MCGRKHLNIVNRKEKDSKTAREIIVKLINKLETTCGTDSRGTLQSPCWEDKKHGMWMMGE